MTLDQVIKLLKKADPAKVFPADTATREQRYRELSLVCHPDRNLDRVDEAKEAFQKLTALYHELTAPKPKTVVKSTKHTYEVDRLLAVGDLADCYLATGDAQPRVLKIARHRQDAKLFAREAQVLQQLQGKTDRQEFGHYFPVCLESFAIRQPGRGVRAINVLDYRPEFFTLEQVRAKYTDGVEPRHFAWMFNRILGALGYAHRQKLVHGAVTPAHMLVRADDDRSGPLHGGILIDWTLSVDDGQKLPIIASAYRDWYPPEVFAKKPVNATLDIYMAAKCGVYLLGGDPKTNQVPKTVPRRLANFLVACLGQHVATRPTDAWSLHEDFHSVLARVFGERKFHHFSMV